MGDTSVPVTAGAGTLLHSWSKTISAATVHDEFTLPGEMPYPTYTVSATGVSSATGLSHMMQVMAGGALNVRIRKIRVAQLVAPAGVNTVELSLVRLTTAGTGGGAVTARPFDTAAAAAGASGMTLPTAKGIEGTVLWIQSFWVGTAAIPVLGLWDWTQLPNDQAIIIPAGAANGFAIKNTSALATATFTIAVEFTETNFV